MGETEYHEAKFFSIQREGTYKHYAVNQCAFVQI